VINCNGSIQFTNRNVNIKQQKEKPMSTDAVDQGVEDEVAADEIDQDPEDDDNDEPEEDDEPEPAPVKKKGPKPKVTKPAPVPKVKPVPVKTKSVAVAKPVADGTIIDGLKKGDIKAAAAYLKLASDATRLRILALVDGEKTVNDLTILAKMSQPALSHHLALLRSSGCVTADRVGKTNLYSLTKPGKTLLKAIKIIADSVRSSEDDDE
jgi:DNA-binding transcriptional ArsR family regulator